MAALTRVPSAGKPEHVKSTELVMRVIVDMRARGLVASRQSIVAATNLPLAVVDDRVKELKKIGKVRLVGGVAGVFEPTEDRMEDRAVSMTYLPSGRVKYEIGDHCIEMSLREAQHSAAAFGGCPLLFNRN